MIPVERFKQLYLKIPWKKESPESEKINEKIIKIQKVSLRDGKAAANACNINYIFFSFAIILKGRKTYKLFRKAISLLKIIKTAYYRIEARIIKKSSMFQRHFR